MQCLQDWPCQGLQKCLGRFNTASGRYYCNWLTPVQPTSYKLHSFNTASGRYYCNERRKSMKGTSTQKVSIPQAVGTIAIIRIVILSIICWRGFNTASDRYYCNLLQLMYKMKKLRYCFNTASGRYYCNGSTNDC